MATRPMSLQSIVAVTPDQVSADLSGEAAILTLASGTYYGLNAVGARVWTLIHEPRSVQSVLEQLLVEYEVEPVRCESDLMNLLRQLAREGLIEVRGD